MVLVGCGGALPVLDFMDAEEDAVFYVIDRCVCVCVCVHARVCACMRACMRVCIHVCVYLQPSAARDLWTLTMCTTKTR